MCVQIILDRFLSLKMIPVMMSRFYQRVRINSNISNYITYSLTFGLTHILTPPLPACCLASTLLFCVTWSGILSYIHFNSDITWHLWMTRPTRLSAERLRPWCNMHEEGKKDEHSGDARWAGRSRKEQEGAGRSRKEQEGAGRSRKDSWHESIHTKSHKQNICI